MSVDVFLNQILSLTFLWSVFVDAFMVTNDTTLLRVDVCLVKIQISLTLLRGPWKPTRFPTRFLDKFIEGQAISVVFVFLCRK